MVHLVIREKVRDLTKGMSVSSDYVQELDEIVRQLIEKSKLRAKANNRNTIMARDL